jgi:dTDP-4-dehydrorhamnose 3,5-epimerase-like enzyme
VNVTIRTSVVDSDKRGFLAKPMTEGQVESVSNVHLVSLEPHAVRGNHYHRNQTEYICVIGGRVKFVAVDNETGERIDTILEGSDAPVITVPPGVTHALQNIGAATNHLLCFSHLESGTGEGDVERNVILE